MPRARIRLSESQARRLRAAALREHISLAEAIRRLIDRGLKVDRAQLYECAARAVGRYCDRRAARDVAREHDRYLDEAFE
jgi:hypothetical protein